MSERIPLARRHPRALGAALWALAVLAAAGCFLWQDTSGPTYPLRGTVGTAKGPVAFEFLRSETIGTDLDVLLLGDVPAGVKGVVRYRRYTSGDAWSERPMEPGDFTYRRRGVVTTRHGLGARLPSLHERAGKYEYFVRIDDGSGAPFSVTGDAPVLARYKGAVPTAVLLVHILVIFVSMVLAVRTSLAAAAGLEFRRLTWATIASFVAGAFVLGPLVQRYAFGVWWSGFPLGGDWTDNKVVVELAAWLVAAWMNRGGRRNRWAVVAAGVVTLVVYAIPHSLFGSEFNYGTGPSRGTGG
jgi:hypothetical protein